VIRYSIPRPRRAACSSPCSRPSRNLNVSLSASAQAKGASALCRTASGSAASPSFQRREAMARRDNGETLAQIARSYAVSVSMISRL
jgi:hypothetical protein